MARVFDTQYGSVQTSSATATTILDIAIPDDSAVGVEIWCIAKSGSDVKHFKVSSLSREPPEETPPRPERP